MLNDKDHHCIPSKRDIQKERFEEMNDKYVDFSSTPVGEKEMAYRELLCEAEEMLESLISLLYKSNFMVQRVRAWKEAKDNV